jgi:adenine deaminase
MKIFGHLVDIHQREIFSACLTVHNGKIANIEKADSVPQIYILPGLIDSHIHIESSMVTPGAFAKEAVKHGTVAVVSDPHEIANVLGKEGVHYMINDGKKVPVKFWFGAPSCVPATSFETSGAILNSEEVGELLKLPEVKYLSEMMNFPGVIYKDQEVLNKISIARKYGKPVDGHAPGLTGDKLKAYINAGISTDHECISLEEAKEKLSLGMKILIREGSAARNLDSLKDLLNTHPDSVMLCSDDLHPEMLVKRHINKLVAKLISEGYNPFDVLRSVTVNPVEHYGLDVGLIRKGDYADFILVDNLNTMNVIQTWIDGIKVFGDNEVLFEYNPGVPINFFNSGPIKEVDLRVKNMHGKFRIIEAFDGELLTRESLHLSGTDEYIEPDTSADILKIVVKDRYNDSPPVIGFIKGIGLKNGAFASSVAHDSHNIISVGTNDNDIASAINEIVKLKGGLSVSADNMIESIQLDIGGIMTTRACSEVAGQYEKLNSKVRSLGCQGAAPFMTLSFMALLVIPELKIGDRGLFNVNNFELVPLFVEE